MNLLFTLLGIAGVACITIGILIHDRVQEDILYLAGGACLLAYSIAKQDGVFIALQLIFMSAAGYDLFHSLKTSP